MQKWPTFANQHSAELDAVPEARLAGMDVMYWGDNSSAIAGVVKGYSARPDSARLVHAIHALLTLLRVRVWFEYVRTSANVSDEPSRADLSRQSYLLLASGTMVGGVGRRLGALCSAPVTCRMPSPEWLLGSQDGVCAAWCVV